MKLKWEYEKEELQQCIVNILFECSMLNNKLSETLDEEARSIGSLATINSDYHSWICRVLGTSKNKKYLTLLKGISMDGTSVKTRKFAGKFSKILSRE